MNNERIQNNSDCQNGRNKEKRKTMEETDWRRWGFEGNLNKKLAKSGQSPERKKDDFVGIQGSKRTVVLEEKL
jgi:hypothetical protein